jgi:acyl-[acyl-carrier-protein]-phospholipid O-acyltransferase/long-chain-fatty-acid--[acyl-carrier-protein] ligase
MKSAIEGAVQTWRTASLSFIARKFKAFFLTPMSALIQRHLEKAKKGRVLLAACLLSLTVGSASEGYDMFVPGARLDHRTILFAALLSFVLATGYGLWRLPNTFLRLILWLLTHTFYRVRVLGRENIPAKGGALLVCNHMSMVDALLLLASTNRSVRFVMLQEIYDHPLMKPFARILRAIPVSSRQRPRDLIHSLRIANEAVRKRELVCIFGEGQISRIGQMLPFRHGLENIMRGVDAPIIPTHLDGVWGSIFSFERGRFVWKVPREIPYAVTVSFGSAMPSTATAFEVRQAVQELGSAAYPYRRNRLLPVHRGFVRTARRHPLHFSMADQRVPKLRFAMTLARTVLLARRLRKEWEGQDMVGLLLPGSVAASLVNFAAMLMGKVPVNLNYKAPSESMASAARQCGITTVVTSKAFLERFPDLKVPGAPIWMEDLAARPNTCEKLTAGLIAWTLPVRLLERAVGRGNPSTLDDLATVIFSSGTTSDPKGVMLTHYNIAANIDQVAQTFPLGHNDRLLGVLPLFHSFGFTATVCLPAVLGLGVVYHPDPRDAKTIGMLARNYATTFLLATPTFLHWYTCGCSPEDFGSLHFVLAGAEKLQEPVAQAFEDKFGICPVEGYGCTECSPVVAVNTRDFRGPGLRHVGAKRNRVGHPLPGVSVRIVDSQTGHPLDPGERGLLLVRGPNVMKGYLGRPDVTSKVLQEGWYNTGDIATLDEDGFLAIFDRLSRFSKIGGEMVPHLAIEEKLQEFAGVVEQSFAVVSLVDEKKGERLVVLHTLRADSLQPVLERLADCPLPSLWKPRPNAFYHVDVLPYLGSGKLDLGKLKQLAADLSETAPS